MPAPVSPPPITVNARLRTMALATARVPAANRGTGPRPSGRSRTRSARPRPGPRRAAPRGAHVQQHLAGRGWRRWPPPMPSAALLAGRDHHVGKEQHQPARPPVQDGAGHGQVAVLPGLAGRRAAQGGQERGRHAPPIRISTAKAQHRLEVPELAGRLGAAQHDHVRPLGPPGQPLQRRDLRLHQVAGRVRQRVQLGHAGVPPVHGAERVATYRSARAAKPLAKAARSA